MDARFERREPRFGKQLVGALLFHLARAQLESGVLELVAHGFKRCDAQADDQGDDEADRKEYWNSRQ